MKMMAWIESEMCYSDLKMAQTCLNDCLERMKGKYGTSEAVSNLEYALSFIRPCFLNEKYYTEVCQKFSNPPNTPKSRRLRWHKDRVSNCKHEFNWKCSLHDKQCCKKEGLKKYCAWYKPEGAKAKGATDEQ